MSNTVGPVVALVVGLAVFVGAYFAMKPGPEPAPEAEPAPKADPVPQPNHAPNPPKSDPEPKKAEPVRKADPEPKKPAVPFVLAGWKSSQLEPPTKGRFPHDVLDIAFEKAGGTVTLRTREAVQVHDAGSGKLLHRVKADPTMSALSSDGRSALVIRDGGAGVDVYSANSLGLTPAVGWVAPKSAYHSFGKVRFSPGGTSLVLADSVIDADPTGSGYAFTTISTRGAATRWPNRLARTSGGLQFGSVVAVPRFERAIYFNSTAKSDQPRVFAIDPKTSTPTPIKSVTIMPEALPDNASLEVSADSTLLLARNTGEIQVVDWRAEKLKLFLKTEQMTTGHVTFRQAALTPDGRHLVVVREYPRFLVTLGPNTGQVRQAPTSIDIHPIHTANQSEKPIARRTAEELGLKQSWASALAVSRDGKAVAVAFGHEVRILDFAAAFGITPGKSLAPGPGEEPPRVP